MWWFCVREATDKCMSRNPRRHSKKETMSEGEKLETVSGYPCTDSLLVD